MTDKEKNPAWGGKRDNSGRRILGRKARCITLTDGEYKLVKEFVQQLRKEK